MYRFAILPNYFKKKLHHGCKNIFRLLWAAATLLAKSDQHMRIAKHDTSIL